MNWVTFFFFFKIVVTISIFFFIYKKDSAILYKTFSNAIFLTFVLFLIMNLISYTIYAKHVLTEPFKMNSFVDFSMVSASFTIGLFWGKLK